MLVGCQASVEELYLHWRKARYEKQVTPFLFVAVASVVLLAASPSWKAGTGNMDMT